MNNHFKRHRFPARIILLAVRWYCRYPLSYRDVQDMLAERNIHVSRSTINRWVVKFGPEIAHKIRALHSPRTLQWHVDETYIRVSGRWRYIKHIDSKWYNNRIESDHASLKRITDPGKGFRDLFEPPKLRFMA